MLLLYGLPVVPLLRGLPVPITRRIARPAPTPAPAAQLRSLAGLTRHRLAGHERRLSRLARPRRLRPRPGKRNHPRQPSISASSSPPCSSGAPSSARGLHARGPTIGESLLYLALSDIVMTMLSGFLTFCDRPVYPFYIAHPNPFGIPVLDGPGPRRSHHVGPRLLRLPRPRHGHHRPPALANPRTPGRDIALPPNPHATIGSTTRSPIPVTK